MRAIEILLRESIDYAGLFPPAELDMGTSLANYVRYRRGPTSWALGRFIVPVGRLPELEVALSQIANGANWRVAALLGPDTSSDLDQLEEFRRRSAGSTLAIDTVEAKATSEGEALEILRQIPPGLQGYLEIPIDRDPTSLLSVIGRTGARAKVRTGGVTPAAFPRTSDLLRFIGACAEAGVPFKATAGLHHPLRADYPLTYAPNSPRATMFGFLNLLLATAFLKAGVDKTAVGQLLEEGSANALQVDDNGIGWRDHRLDSKSLTDARRTGMISFGSCSFTEPIADLESLHLLQPRAQWA